MPPARPHIVVYAQHWHLTRSAAFHDLLIDPLQPYFDFDLIGWDYGKPISPPEPGANYIFCQLHPPKQYLHEDAVRCIWLPMWDEVRFLPQRQWNRLSKTLRVAAFSEAVYARAQRAGLTTLRLQYYKNPAEFEPVNWTQGRVLFYWNRVGLVNPDFLVRFCEVLKVDTLLFKNDTDPAYENLAGYDLPAKLGRTEVKLLPTFASREQYLKATREANIFIAPRIAEGAGMAFLEAMARGCAVFAYDGATMNEYITGGEDGYFFKRIWNAGLAVENARRKLSHLGVGKRPQYKYTLRESAQNWNEIATLDIQELGETARQRHQQGYNRWQSEIPRYTDFLLEAMAP